MVLFYLLYLQGFSIGLSSVNYSTLFDWRVGGSFRALRSGVYSDSMLSTTTVLLGLLGLSISIFEYSSS